MDLRRPGPYRESGRHRRGASGRPGVGAGQWGSKGCPGQRANARSPTGTQPHVQPGMPRPAPENALGLIRWSEVSSSEEPKQRERRLSR